jgi:hypothetical protein
MTVLNDEGTPRLDSDGLPFLGKLVVKGTTEDRWLLESRTGALIPLLGTPAEAIPSGATANKQLIELENKTPQNPFNLNGTVVGALDFLHANHWDIGQTLDRFDRCKHGFVVTHEVPTVQRTETSFTVDSTSVGRYIERLLRQVNGVCTTCQL